MKALSLTLILLISQNLVAQNWREDLTDARRLYEQKRYNEAWERYQKADKNAPDNAAISEELGQSAYRANQFEEAEKQFRKAAAARKTTKDRARNWHNVGGACAKQRKYDEAEQAYKETLRLDPSNEQARYNLSEVRRRKKARQQNEERKAQKQKPTSPQQNQTESQQQSPNQGSQNPQKQPPAGSPNKSGKQRGKLDDQNTERTLDQLARKEAETKRKISARPAKTRSGKSAKDW